MPPTSVTVRTPATSANLGPGFDSLGLALDIAGEITVTWHDRPPRRADSRSDQFALGAARALFQRVSRPAPPGLRAHYDGDIPVGRGLGMSAVLRVGAIVGANALLGEPLDREAVLALAADLEGHADNAAPALLGGVQVCVVTADRILHLPVPVPDAVTAALFVPDLDMPTSESRRLLPTQLSRADCVHNIGRAALLVAGLATGRLDVLDVATQDVLHQPARSRLFPEMFDIFAAARAAGALCAYLSGGGSSIMALVDGDGAAVGAAMVACARSAGRTGRLILTRPSPRGAEIIRQS